MVDMSVIALIPARAGSKRIPGKNIRLLGGKPLMAWSIEAAIGSGIFAGVCICTDNVIYGEIASCCGASVIHRAPSQDDEPDIVWVVEALKRVPCDAFAILRPTSPFRTADTIRRAWRQFVDNQPCDSLRAVELVTQHPYKMWTLVGDRMKPLIPGDNPFLAYLASWHSSPTQTLPPVYLQNASLEIAWANLATKGGTIAGDNVLPFFTTGREGFDINTKQDFAEAEKIVEGIYGSGPSGLSPR